MQTVSEIVINVQELEPRLRHLTIFETFDKLQQGESLIIHNNHDPKPVYYQLMDIRGNIFSWEYLEQGPQWWDIRVTKIVPPIPTAEKDLVINVPVISPQLKHQTIFHVFDNMNAGETFVIHNDHDPKPLYYQLLGERGDVFTWEYLHQGPQWWDVRVTIKPVENDSRIPVQAATPLTAAATAETSDRVIDVPSLEPKQKHPRIFEVFDSLQAGESLVIHNDHDPKPVYYQLLGERGDVFTWEYLQQGPQWWDVKVTRKSADETETIGQIAAKDLRKAEVFKKYGIDFCCGGKKTLRQVCAEKGIDASKVEQELQAPIASVTAASINYGDWSLSFLSDYIVNTHHHYVRKYLPEIKGYAIKVAQVHGDVHPELAEVKELVLQVDEELTQHMVDEENILFPLIKKIELAATDKKGLPAADKPFASIVAETEEEHDHVGRAMEEIRRLTQNYTVPADGCASYKLLFKMLEEFESDLFIHIHLENNILFPKADDLEKSLL